MDLVQLINIDMPIDNHEGHMEKGIAVLIDIELRFVNFSYFNPSLLDSLESISLVESLRALESPLTARILLL